MSGSSTSIAGARLYHLALPMHRSFELSGGIIARKETLIVEVIDREGRSGWGEAPVLLDPIYTTETVAGAKAFLLRSVLPDLPSKVVPLDKLLGPNSLDEVMVTYHRFRGFQFAKCAVEAALCSLAAISKQVSLRTLLGGIRDEIEVGESIGIQPVEKVMQSIHEALNFGYKRIKVKITHGHDIDLVERIRREWPRLPLMVDANGEYRLEDVDVFHRFDRLSLMMIEQPLDYDDLIDHAVLQSQLQTPICLDESIVSLRHAEQALRIGACRIINIKPCRVGGPIQAKKIHDLCQQRGVPVWCGGMFESGIGRAVNLAIASLAGASCPSDMSPAADFYGYDLVARPHVIRQGKVAIPNDPGLGFAVDMGGIKRCLVDCVEFGECP
ncbi:MAG: o-succinylbenzoate synthase [Planctomycetia bacterium]|nr:o-succinylbenzoate synthase [Planctomycetia bacterium]